MSCNSVEDAVRHLCESVLNGRGPFQAFVSMNLYYMFSLPITITNIFGLYIIFFHSRMSFKQLRVQMFLLHAFSFATDFFISDLLRPTIYWPLALGHLNGPLCTVLHVPPLHALFITATLFALLPPSIFQVIVNKHQILQPPGSWMKMPRWMFWAATCIMYGGTFVLVLSALLIVDDVQLGPIKLNRTYPFLSEYFFAPNAIMIYWQSNIYMILWGFAVMTGVIGCGICGAILIGSCWHTIKSRSSSRRTRQMEMRLLIALCVQLLVPVGIYIIPILYTYIVVYHEIWFVQELTNFILFICTTHAFVATLILIGMNKSYRETTKSIVLRFKVPNSMSEKSHISVRSSTMRRKTEPCVTRNANY